MKFGDGRPVRRALAVFCLPAMGRAIIAVEERLPRYLIDTVLFKLFNDVVPAGEILGL
jgi:hypothetical protein